MSAFRDVARQMTDLELRELFREGAEWDATGSLRGELIKNLVTEAGVNPRGSTSPVLLYSAALHAVHGELADRYLNGTRHTPWRTVTMTLPGSDEPVVVCTRQAGDRVLVVHENNNGRYVADVFRPNPAVALRDASFTTHPSLWGTRKEATDALDNDYPPTVTW